LPKIELYEKVNQTGGTVFFRAKSLIFIAPDLGTARMGVRASQAVSHALSFFRSDGFAVPAPAQRSAAQAVGRLISASSQSLSKKINLEDKNYCT